MKRILAKVLILLLLFNLGSGALPNSSQAIPMSVDSSLKFDLEPYVAQQGLDYIAVQFKVSRASCLYYKAVPPGTPVTNADVMGGGNYADFMFGATSNVQFDNLLPGTSYDLCFVLTDPENYKIASETPLIIESQETAPIDTATGNGIQGATYGNSSMPGDPHANGAHIYFALEAPNFLPTPVQPDPEDILITFPSSSTGTSGPRTLSDTEYTIEPMIKGARMMDIWIKPETFATGTLSTYLVTTPGAIDISVIDHNGFNPAITGYANISLPAIDSNVLDGETPPMMYPKGYIEDAEGDYILVQLDRSVSVSNLPLYSDFMVTAQGLPQNPIAALTPIETAAGYAQSFKLELSPTAQSYVRSQTNLPFTISFYSQMSSLMLVNDAYNPYYIQYDVAGSDINNEISSIKFFDGTDYVMTAIRESGYNEFNLKVPYIALTQENYKKFLSASKITLASPHACADTLMDGGMFINVRALNGAQAQYALMFQPDVLTLGGLSFGGTPVATFNPYQNPTIPYQINTSTLYTLSTLPNLSAVYNTQAGTQCTISAPTALSGTGNFAYTITLSDGLTTPTTKTYTVHVLYSGTTPTTPTTPDQENGAGGASTPPPTAPTGIDPTQPYDPFKGLGETKPSPEQIVQEVNRLTGLISPEQSGNIGNLMGNFDTLFRSVTNSEQAYQTLGAMDVVLSKLKLDTPDPTANANMAKFAEDLTFNMESKLLLINTPKQQLEVLTGFVNAAKPLQVSGVPLTNMNQSVGEMLQKTALNFGTAEIQAPVTGDPVVVQRSLIEDLINNQTEALKALNDLQSRFFESGSQQPLKPEIRLDIKGTGGAERLAVGLQKEIVDLLKAQSVDSLSLREQVVEMKIPVSDLRPGTPVELIIAQRPAPPSTQVLPEPPKVTYEFSMNINNFPQETFNKPITLSFELSAFGYSGSAGGGLSVGRFNESLNIWEPVGGILDPQSGTIYVKRNHLSQYTVLKTKKSFSDADNSWAKEEINAMLNKGIVTDTAKFEPKSLLTRGEFAQWIANAYGLKVSDKSLPFKDVPKDSEYYSAIAAVYQQGILQGSKDKFNPNKPLTQNELAAALGKVLVSFDNKQKSDKVTSKYLAKLKTTQVASWAEDDMALLMELGMAVDTKSGSSGISKEVAASAFMKFYRS